MARMISVLLALAALAVAGCGGSSSNSSSSDTSAATTSAAAPSTTAGSTTTATSGAVTVTMKNIQFAPKSVTVKKGQTVKWVNEDAVDHNVVATSGGSFKSSNFGQGGTYSQTFKTAGTVEYVCTIHPGMGGTVIVK